MNNFKRICCVLPMVLMAPSLRGAEPAPLATVDGEPITRKMMVDEFVRRHGGHTKFLLGESEIRAFLDQVIDWRLLVHEAYRLGLDDDPDIAAATEEYAWSKSIEYLLKEELEGKAEPTEEELEGIWRSSGEQFVVRQIVTPDRATAVEVRRRILAGADAEELARTCSIAPSRTHGGLMPPIRWGMMSEEWEAVVFELDPPELSEPFRTDEGWEVVQLLARAPMALPEYGEVRSKIKGVLLERERQRRRVEFSEELKQRYGFEWAVEDRSPGNLAQRLEEAPDTVLATWDDGELDLRTFVQGLDLRLLASMPGETARRHLDDLLARTVNDALVRRDVLARAIDEVPEVADDIATRREVLMERVLYGRYMLQDVEVTEDEVHTWYDEHGDELTAPERRRIAHIVTPTREEAELVRRRLQAGDSFEELAEEHSTDSQTASQGGGLGWVTEREIPEGFEVVSELAAGEVSPPLESEFGWHVVRVLMIEPERPYEFDEIREKLHEKILENRKTALRKEWIAKLREAATIVVDDAAIAAFAKAGTEP